MQTKKYLIISLLFFVLIISSFSYISIGQISTNIISMSGKDWNFNVLNGGLEKTAFSVETSKGKELRYIFNSLAEAEKYNGIISFPISLNGLKYYYQLPLNQQENINEYDFVNSTHAIRGKDIIVFRPEDIVDSYAIYNNSGFKVMHIYRSKLIDFKGNFIWAEMKLNDNLLSVIFNIDWIKNANFPVIIDPTFGYTSIGGSVINGGQPWKAAGLFSLTESATVTSITSYLNGTGNAKCAIYSNVAGVPTTLQGGSTSEVTISGTNWYTFNYSSTVELTSGSWWLDEISDTADLSWCYDSGGTSVWSNQITYTNEPVNPFGTYNTRTDLISIYATYTIGGQNITISLNAGFSIGTGLGSQKSLYKETEITTSFSSNGLTQKNMFKSNSEIIYFTSMFYTQKSITGSLITSVADLFKINGFSYSKLPITVVIPESIINDKLDLIIAISIICFCAVLVVIVYIPERKNKK